MPDVWGLAAIATKFLLYLGVLTSVGLILGRVVFGAQLAGMDRHVRGLAFGFVCIALISAVLSFAIRGAVLMDDISGMTDPSILSLLWETPPGDALLLRALGLTILAFGIGVGGRTLWVGIVGGALALWSFCEIGHVASQERLLAQVVLFLHLLAAAFWIGILTPLKSLARDETQRELVAELGTRFGHVASGVVPLLILAGIVMTWWLVGSVTAMFGTAYGQALLGKLVVVGGLLGLAFMNKTRLVPAIEQGEQDAATRLARSISIEWACVALILLATATFTSILTVPG